MIAARPSGDVDVFAKLDAALGAHDEQPPVAPDGQPILREPVDPDESGRAVGSEKDLAEILKLRFLRMVEVGDVACHALRFLRAGEKQELLDLMRADIAQDA